MNNEVSQLEKRIEKMILWKKQRDSERISFPLDENSIKSIEEYRTTFFNGWIKSKGNLTSPYLDLYYSTELFAKGIEVDINGKKRVILVFPVPMEFGVNTTTDVITTTNGAHNLKNGNAVIFMTTDTLPSGIPFFGYVVNSTSATFQVATTVGGSPVDITSSGVGTQYLTLF